MILKGGYSDMDRGLSIFSTNIIGGIALFYLLTILLGFTGGTMDTAALVGIFLFIQLSFVTTLLIKILYKLNN